MLYSTTNGLNRWLYHVHLKITYLASLRVGFYMHQLGRFVHSGVSISLLILFVCLPVLIIKREVLKSSTVIEDLPFFFLFFSSTLPQIFWSSGITLLYLRDVSPFILLQWAYVSQVPVFLLESEHLTVKWAPRKWGAVRLPFLSVPTPSSFQWRSGSGTTWCDHLWVCGEAYAHALFYFVPLFFVPPFFLPSFWITSFYYGVLSLLLSLHYFF